MCGSLTCLLAGAMPAGPFRDLRHDDVLYASVLGILMALAAQLMVASRQSTLPTRARWRRAIAAQLIATVFACMPMVHSGVRATAILVHDFAEVSPVGAIVAGAYCLGLFPVVTVGAAVRIARRHAAGEGRA